MNHGSEPDGRLLQILRVASRVFAEKGYDGAGMRDISAATGLGLSGLYHYVRSKEDLLFRVQDHCLGTLLDRLERELEGVDEPERRLRLLIRNHLLFFADNPAEMKVLARETSALTGEYRAHVQAKQRRYAGLLTEILVHLDPPEVRHLRTAAFSLFGIMNWLHTWYREGQDLPVQALEDEVLRLFLHGFLTAAPPADPDVGVELPSRAGVAQASVWRSR